MPLTENILQKMKIKAFLGKDIIYCQQTFNKGNIMW